MFTPTRIAAGAAILALVGSLALYSGPAWDDPSSLPGAAMADIDPAEFGGFAGTMLCDQGDPGTIDTTAWGSIVEGETYSRCVVQVGDPRFSGNLYSVHDYYRYDGRPQWGVRNVSAVLTNQDGQWLTTSDWGYQHPDDQTMAYAMQFQGMGAYEGLSALAFLMQDTWGLSFDIEGVIIPGELPEAPEHPLEAALAQQQELAAD